MKKVKVSEERLFCETETFLKQVMVSIGISKADTTSVLLSLTWCCWNAPSYQENDGLPENPFKLYR